MISSDDEYLILNDDYIVATSGLIQIADVTPGKITVQFCYNRTLIIHL